MNATNNDKDKRKIGKILTIVDKVLIVLTDEELFSINKINLNVVKEKWAKKWKGYSRRINENGQ